MKRIMVVIMLLTIQPSVSFSSGGNTEDATKAFAYKSLAKAILYSADKTLSGKHNEATANPSGLIILLGEVDSKESRTLLLQLLEVYIGSATGEALGYAIVRQGTTIEDELRGLLSKPVECALLENYKFEALRCLSQESRDRNIQWLLQLIEEGKTIEYVP